MAPIPSVMRLMGPNARLRLCSPVSPASDISISRGFVARRFAMQVIVSFLIANLVRAFDGSRSGFRCHSLGSTRPGVKNRDAKQHNNQTGPRILRLIAQQDYINVERHDDINRW